MTHKLIYDQTIDDIRIYLTEIGQPSYRALQIWHGLYKNLWNHPSQFSNIPLDLRKKIENDFTFTSLISQKELCSTDGKTIKTLYQLYDYQALETVLIKYADKRRTLCISTQVGCKLGCVFCATGQMGFRRNLTSGEICEQVINSEKNLQTNNEKLTNIVVMGMGEPFDNYSNTMNAMDRLINPEGFNLGARRITISTAGIIPGIEKFAEERRQINLAISLHSANKIIRNQLMPINKKYPLNELIDACKVYINNTKRRITFEWALINNINDHITSAKELSQLLSGMLCHVNLILLNPSYQYHEKPSTMSKALAFIDILQKSGIPCSIRARRGIDINAACGQLAVVRSKMN